MSPPLSSPRFWAKLIRAGAEQTLPVVPDADGEMDTDRLFCQGPALWWCSEEPWRYGRSETHTH